MTLDTKHLKNKKNLLAFSAGVDSSALFFLLIAKNIQFDIAIVDYGIREKSKKEITHAQTLAKKYNLTCYTVQAPKFDSHFESKARKFRYAFFESLIKAEGYDNLLTAHQLDDQLEWLLMRFTKGAGVSELLGLEPVTRRENYTLLRPLLAYSKDELLTYLKEHAHPYFIDASNEDDKYERNRFRKQFSNPLIAQYKEGIRRSFEYLRKDKEALDEGYEVIYSHKELKIIKLHTQNAKSKAADMTLKTLGYLLSASQRQEIEKEQSLVIGGVWTVELQDDLLYIAPYVTIDMSKKFKEACRVNKVPSKIRPYLYQKDIDPKLLTLHSSFG